MWFGVEWMAYSLLITSVISQVVNSFPNKKLLNYSFFEQMKDIMPSVLLSAIMGVIVLSVTFIGLNDILTLLIQVPVGVLVYVLGAKIFKLESFEYLWTMVKEILGKRRKHKETEVK